MSILLFWVHMRKFALLPLIFGFVGATSVFAQPRDLFAEFEEEAAAAESSAAAVSSAAVPASSAAVPASSAANPASSAAVPMSSAAVASSSSVALSSSSAPISSSSVVPSSSSVLVSSSSVELSSSSEAVSSSSIESSSSEVPSSSSVVADSAAVAVAPVDSAAAQVPADSLPLDSAAQARADSIRNDSLGRAYAAEKEAAIQASIAEARKRDSLEALSSSSADAPVVPSSSSMSRRDLLGPVKVSKVNGIDEMKGKYKSPRKALFMSLVVPGSGQLYVGGSTFTNVRGVAYLALEAALWGSWYYFSVYKYDNQVSRYKKFAKSHYSIGRYETGMRELFGQLADETEESRFETRYMSSRENFCEALYGTATHNGCYTRGTLFYNDKNHKNLFAEENPLGKELKTLRKVDDEDALYQEISNRSYVLGWDDVQDAKLAINLGLEDDGSSVEPLASSKHMKEYRDMRSKANDYADMQAWFFGGIILNHLISAVDAAFTANAHNKELYSEDLSWYDHLHFDSYMSFVNGVDVGVQASWGF